ncbi:hypothetical protein ACOACO_11630 [Nocardioides sp. CPCC 205120]|uniref:hypothetical protein n=1 Tax=Nocardioides sp. CPCC 205120 TaxID=3406462 RepID=UPI003B50E5DA
MDEIVRARARAADAVPGWWADVGRMALYASGSITLWTGILWVGTLGMLHHRASPIDPETIQPGIFAAAPVLAWPFLQLSTERRDRGFRAAGLPGLMVCTISAGAVIHLLGMLLWPMIMGDRAAPGTVAAELHRNPTAMLLTLAFLLAGMSWFTTIAQAMIFWPLSAGLIALVPFLAGIFVIPFAGLAVFQGVAATGTLALWGLLALSGMVAVWVVSHRVTRQRQAGAIR